MFKIVSLAILCLAHVATCDYAGLEVRVTDQGLDYVAQVAMKVLAVELPKLKIPDITSGDITASNFVVTRFSPPVAQIALQSSSIFTLSLTNADLGLTCKVKACKKILGENICASVNAELEASNVNVQASGHIVLTDDKERFTISTPTCQTNIGTLALKTSGGPLGWILDLFHSIIAKEVKPDIEKAVNEQAISGIETKLDPILAKLKVDIEIGQSYDFDYQLVSEPAITPQHFQVDLEGKVTCPARPSLVSPYPSTPLATQSEADSKMACIVFSDKIINDFLFFAHNLNQTAYLATKDTPQIGQMMYLHCSTICLGSLIPNVDQLYPNVEAAEAYVSTTDPPTIELQANGDAVISADVNIHIFAPNTTVNATILLSKTTSKSSLFVDVENNKIVGNINITDITMSIQESRMDPDIMQYVLDHIDDIVKPAIQKIANEILQPGFKIPTFGKGKGSFVNPQIRFLKDTAQIESDVAFNI
jgi:hypothetical protein